MVGRAYYLGWPGIATIARGAGCGETQASAAIKALLAHPAAPITQTLGSRHQPAVYRFTPAVFEAAGKATPATLALPLVEAVRLQGKWRGPEFRPSNRARGPEIEAVDGRKTKIKGAGIPASISLIISLKPRRRGGDGMEPNPGPSTLNASRYDGERG